MQMPGSIAAADLPSDDRPSDAAFGHVVFGRNATILRPLKDPLGDILRSAALSPVAPCSHTSDALLLRCSDAEVGQDRVSGVD